MTKRYEEIRRGRLSELAALGRVPCGFSDCDLRTAAATGAELEAAEVQDIECDLVALPDFSEQVFCGHFDVLQDHSRRR